VDNASPAVLKFPLTPRQAAARAKDGLLEAVVVLDVLELINADKDRWVEIVVEEVLQDRSQWRSVSPLRILGTAPGYPDNDPRRQYMPVRVRVRVRLKLN
jgi:hypothetical protein